MATVTLSQREQPLRMPQPLGRLAVSMTVVARLIGAADEVPVFASRIRLP